MENDSTLMPATAQPLAQYYVGDLCYVMHDCWDEVCDLLFGGDDGINTGEIQLADGRKFFIFNTAYGDGQYNDRDGNPYSVDSGTIGAIKVDDITDRDGFESTIEHGNGHVHEFPEELYGFDCSEVNGLITIYDVSIDTNYDDYDEE